MAQIAVVYPTIEDYDPIRTKLTIKYGPGEKRNQKRKQVFVKKL